MLKEEAIWIKNEFNKLIDLKTKIYPIGNVGCSDEKQDNFQPWVKELVDYIDANGEKLNIDIKDSPNVDLVGDLLDDNFISHLKTKNINSVLCANILTNIEDKEKFAKSIVNILPKGGVLIISVSNKYPYVADPVDTLYRPTPDEVALLFPNTVITSKAIIESKTYAQLLWGKKKTLLITICRLFVPFYKPKTWWQIIKYLPQSFKPVKASCVVLKKI